jgi:hypothetical protein
VQLFPIDLWFAGPGQPRGGRCRNRLLAQWLAKNGGPFMRALTVMVVHDHQLTRSSFSHQSLNLGVKYHRRLISVNNRLERDRSLVRIRTKNNLESPRPAATHGFSS